MKRLSSFFALLCFSLLHSHVSLAQGKVYVEITPAYGFAASCRLISVSSFADDNGSSLQEGIYGSYGSGFSPGVGAGYNFCRNVGVQLRASYIFGTKYTSTDAYDFSTSEFTGHYSDQANTFVVEPMLNFFTDREEKQLNYYARVGIMLPLFANGKFTSDEEFGDPYTGTTKTDAVLELKNSFSIGYTGAAGIILSIAEHLGLFGEAYYRGLSLSWKKGSYTEYTEIQTSPFGNNTITLEDLDVSEKEFEFKETVSQEDNIDPGKPAVNLKQFYSFSSAGFGAGLRYTF